MLREAQGGRERERQREKSGLYKRIFQAIIYSCTDKQSINKIEQNHNDTCDGFTRFELQTLSYDQ